jgi:hypothetical protein
MSGKAQCNEWRQKYGIVPFQSWSTPIDAAPWGDPAKLAPMEVQEKWIAMDCEYLMGLSQPREISVETSIPVSLLSLLLSLLLRSSFLRSCFVC